MENMHMFTEVAPGVYSVEHRVAEGKNAVIFGQRGAIAIDTGTYPEEGQALADFIVAQGYTPNRLIYTHGHGDHILGSRIFRGAEIYAHALMPIEARRLLPQLANRAAISTDELADQIAWPTITFSDELWIDLGDKHLWLFPAPGHSQDGVSVYVEEEKLLVAGDAVVTGIVPAIGNGDSQVLEASLHRLTDLAIDILIPGHGPVVYGQAAVTDWLHWLSAYLRNVRLAVRAALDEALAPEQVLDRVGGRAGYEQFVGDRLPQDRHKMPSRHRDTVQKIVQEIVEEIVREESQ